MVISEGFTMFNAKARVFDMCSVVMGIFSLLGAVFRVRIAMLEAMVRSVRLLVDRLLICILMMLTVTMLVPFVMHWLLFHFDPIMMLLDRLGIVIVVMSSLDVLIVRASTVKILWN